MSNSVISKSLPYYARIIFFIPHTASTFNLRCLSFLTIFNNLLRCHQCILTELGHTCISGLQIHLSENSLKNEVMNHMLVKLSWS